MKLINGTTKMDDNRIMTIQDEVMNGKMKKSPAIRELFHMGFSVKEITDKLKSSGVKYQHVYNIVNNEVTTKGLMDNVEKSTRGNPERKEEILKRLKAGETIMKISRDLGILYNSVWMIAKSHGYTKKQIESVPEVQEEKKVAKKGKEKEAV